MKFVKPRCPKCGELAVGTLEKLQGCAELDWQDEEGNAEYSGSTDIHWNSQETVRPTSNTVILYCANKGCYEDWVSEVVE